MTSGKIRVSVGSASVLGLENHKNFKELPTTCYLMTFIIGRCSANCGFCPQSRNSDSSTEKLSRISWPAYSMDEVVEKFKELPSERNFKRACVQTLNYPQNFNDVIEIIRKLKKGFSGPISVAIPPIDKEKMQQLKDGGVDRIGIALDGSTPAIFEEIKGRKNNGPYAWDTHLNALDNALEIFPKGHVSTHLIVGLGESEEEILRLIKVLHDKSILVSLFAFTPIKGTKLENRSQPDILSFRKIQLGRYLIVNDIKSIRDFIFDEYGTLKSIKIKEVELKLIIEESVAFMTSGCPGCNRPYYTSKPSGPFFNYPRKLTNQEKDQIYKLLHPFTIN
ncbi:MAG: radical SAM protein [Candidatus Lokiarchaeota archaeon]|nr:radical SAM protein [Candidatus Lokiarchaeota archaeon]